MPWLKAFHIIFMVTWFAGLYVFLPGHRSSWPGPGSPSAARVRAGSRTLRVRAAIPGGTNSPAGLSLQGMVD